MTPKITSAPRVQIAEGLLYGLTLSVAEYAALTGTLVDNAYAAVRAGTTPVPVIKLSPVRYAFSTVATCKLLGLDYEIVSGDVAVKVPA